jgi:hypothetical protein
MLGLLVIYDVAPVSTSYLYLEILQSTFFNIVVIITSSSLSSDLGSLFIESFFVLYYPLR